MTKIKIDQIEKEGATSFTRLKKYEYNYATQFQRDGCRCGSCRNAGKSPRAWRARGRPHQGLGHAGDIETSRSPSIPRYRQPDRRPGKDTPSHFLLFHGHFHHPS